jgi:hypothetical protein
MLGGCKVNNAPIAFEDAKIRVRRIKTLVPHMNSLVRPIVEFRPSWHMGVA